MNTLNNDCLRVLFSYTEPHDLGACCQVSKSWRDVASEDRFWGEIVPDELAKVDKKKYFDAHVLTSHEEIVDRIKRFINNSSKNCRFSCRVPFESDDCFTLWFFQHPLFYSFIPSEEIEQEHCIFIKKKSNEIISDDFSYNQENVFLGRISLGCNYSYMGTYCLPKLENSEVKYNFKENLKNVLNSRMTEVITQTEMRRRNMLLGGIAVLGMAALGSYFGAKD